MSTAHTSRVTPPPLPARRFVLPKAVLTSPAAKSWTAEKKTVVALAVVATLLLFAIVVFLADKVLFARKSQMGTQGVLGTMAGSGFEVEYSFCESRPGIDVTVRGKAVKLAVIFTTPDGTSETKIIESDRMITNSCTTYFALFNYPKPGTSWTSWTSGTSGTHVLTVKTFVPERVVCKKEFTLSSGNLEVEDVQPVFAEFDKGEFVLKEIKVSLRKEGNLPILFAGANGSYGRYGFTTIGWVQDSWMTKQKHTVVIHVPPTRNTFKAGERCPIAGTLFLDREEKIPIIEFRKDFVVPR